MQTGHNFEPDRDYPSVVNAAEGITLAQSNRYILVGDIAKVYGRTNYIAMAGYTPSATSNVGDAYRGIFGYKSKTKIPSISDGTSNTIAFMETAGGYIDFGGTTGAGWVGAMYTMGAQFSNFGVCPNSTNGNCVTGSLGRGLAAGMPGSNHGGNRINVGFGDGSIRTFSPSVDFNTFVYLCGKSDGQVVTFDN